MIKAIIFDLYDTLVFTRQKSFIRDFYKQHLMQLRGGREVGEVRQLVSAIRDKLMTIDLSAYPIPDEFISFLSSGSSQKRSYLEKIEKEFRNTLIAEAESTRLLIGAIEVLQLFKRRGYLLGVVSNVSTYHKKPFFDFGLNELIDEVVFSCDFGRAKPGVEIYLEACRRLGVMPSETVFVGDNYKIDVQVPISLGMQAIHVSKTSAYQNHIDTISDMGLVVLDNANIFCAKKSIEREFDAQGDNYTLKDIILQSDLLGKYNLVYRCTVSNGQQEKAFFLKRHFNPTASLIDHMAQYIARLTSLQDIEPITIDVGNEPFLLVPEVPGVRYYKGREVTRSLLYYIGKHTAFSYIFANVDSHPRNAFVERCEDIDVIRMIDYENCFFDSKYNFPDTVNPNDPESIDAYFKDASEVRIPKKTLTPKTIKRFLFNFVDRMTTSQDELLVIYTGIEDYYRIIAQRQDQILEMLYRRQKQRPYLMVGFYNHQRALTRADIDRIQSRMDYTNVAYLTDVIAS